MFTAPRCLGLTTQSWGRAAEADITVAWKPLEALLFVAFSAPTIWSRNRIAVTLRILHLLSVFIDLT
jgi:hypothetical protein